MTNRIKSLPSPNRGGKCKSLLYIVMHHTGSTNFNSTVSYLRKKSTAASANFVVGKKGEIAQLVPVGTAAWHAGKGGPYGKVPRDLMNHYSVGIEMVNKGDNKDAYTTVQLQALDWLISYIDTVAGKKLTIIDHKAWAPKRKNDVRANFPLANYKKYRSFKKPVAKASASKTRFTLTRVLKKGSQGHDVKMLQAALGITVDGDFGSDTQTALNKFKRSRHMKLINGKAGSGVAKQLGWNWKK